ncbi:AsmA family protein [Sphingobium sp.]|uniref:AsmA family protein n=1 Tax=Sphingobium sp. TaxID=1912891 RepID=UPI003BB80EF7
MDQSGSRGRVWMIRIGSGLLLLVGLLTLLLAMMPWGLFKDRIAQRLSDRIGKPVTITTMEREDSLSLHPVVRLTGIRVPQPDWAPQDMGNLATIGEARVGFSAMALITGGPVLETLDVKKAHIALYRARDGQESWTGERSKGDDSRGKRPALRSLNVTDSHILYRDDKRERSIDANLAVDAAGLRLSGTGRVRGYPVRVTAKGAPILGHRPGTRWPFRADIAGDAVGLTLDGTMDGPLDVGHLRGKATAHAIDLKILDAILEAGLPGTQPVRIVAQVVRDKPDWTIQSLKGTIGRSDIAGHATIRKQDGRTRIDGAIRAARFDFNDLSSDEGQRKAAAKRARLGDRLVPDTAIDLHNLARTDGRLELQADRLLWPGSSPFRALKGVLALDHSRLTVAPLAMGLTRGTMSGQLVVDQRSGGPTLDIKLDLHSARLLDFFPRTHIDGALVGRFALNGRGKTIREAIGRSNGVVALVARDGSIPARTAALMGQDVGKALTLDATKMATLRCAVARFTVKGGAARADPVLIDTSRAQTRATGGFNLSNETLDLTLSGQPKQGSLLRIDGSVPVRGTIKAPHIVVPEGVRSAKNIFKMIGKAIAGDKRPKATDADCDGLARSALR